MRERKHLDDSIEYVYGVFEGYCHGKATSLGVDIAMAMLAFHLSKPLTDSQKDLLMRHTRLPVTNAAKALEYVPKEPQLAVYEFVKKNPSVDLKFSTRLQSEIFAQVRKGETIRNISMNLGKSIRVVAMSLARMWWVCRHYDITLGNTPMGSYPIKMFGFNEALQQFTAEASAIKFTVTYNELPVTINIVGETTRSFKYCKTEDHDGTPIGWWYDEVNGPCRLLVINK